MDKETTLEKQWWCNICRCDYHKSEWDHSKCNITNWGAAEKVRSKAGEKNE